MKWVFLDDGLDLFATSADRQDDSPVSRDLSTRDEKVTRCVVFLQEFDVRRHVRIDFSEVDLVGQFDEKHLLSLSQMSFERK